MSFAHAGLVLNRFTRLTTITQCAQITHITLILTIKSIIGSLYAVSIAQMLVMASTHHDKVSGTFSSLHFIVSFKFLRASVVVIVIVVEY